MAARHTLGIDVDTMLYVPVYLNGRGPYTFLLETGCLGFNCAPEVARELGLSTEGDAPPVLQSLEIGSYRRADLPIGLYDTVHVCSTLGRRVDGFLGNRPGPVSPFSGRERRSAGTCRSS